MGNVVEYVFLYFRRKKKMELCSFVADTMCSSNVKTAPNFASLLSFSIETLLQLCNDGDSDIRMVADESLNRIIRVCTILVQVNLSYQLMDRSDVKDKFKISDSL